MAKDSQIRRGHSMTVPDWIWHWGQSEFGAENPASRLLDILTEAISDLKNQRMSSGTAQNDRKSKEDEGHIFRARRAGLCAYDGRTFSEGTEIIVCEGKYFHLECFNKMKGKLL